MSSSILKCPTCQAPVSVFDQYCGVCGAVLARLRWRTPDEEQWKSGDGYVAVRKGAKTARVLFRNEGVVPAGLVLQAEDLANLPVWVDREALGERILIVASEDEELEIPLVIDSLALLFEEQESSRPNPIEREAHLPFLTNLIELRDGRWTSRPFKLTLLAARPPHISPACSLYRFLPIERLAGEGVEHEIEITNETIQALELSEVRISNDDSEPEHPGCIRIPWQAVVHREPLDLRRIAPGDSWTDTALRLALPNLPNFSPESLGWFSVLIEYLDEKAGRRDRPPLQCLVQGTVGRGPTLKVKGHSSLWVPLEQAQQERSFALENPGQIPVAVVSIEVLRERDGEMHLAPERDWLSFSGLSSGDLVKPGETRTLSFSLHPSKRPSDEFEEPDCQRLIRVRHDGLPSPTEQVLDLIVLARFGKAEEILAGIDFGTTNSVVCVGNKHSYALRLEPGFDHQDRIRSLMYFDSTLSSDLANDRFLFGEEAHSSAGIRPENLVRSIKSVVARDPRTKYVFYKRTQGLGDQPVTKTPQDLLNIFIAELRTRSENGVNYLPPEAYPQLGVELGTQLTLSRAVFSHPVTMPKEARRALMEAAHRAGINETIDDVDEFFEQNCIDEATAAVLAYVAGRVRNPPIIDLPPSDCERVLCFDMGGGTTDLAAVEVLNMAAFRANPGGTRVIVNLDAKDGARFGGDDLDQVLACLILTEVRRQSELRSAPVVLEEFLRAIQSRSYAAFRMDYQRRHSMEIKGIEKHTEDDALSLYLLAAKILGKSEEAKRKLSNAHDSVTIDLPGTGWPREEETSQAEAEDFEVQLRRKAFEKKVRALVLEHLPLLDSVVQGAGWEWPSVTTLLFTGQSARVPVIRKEVARHVTKQRGAGARPLLRIDPGQGKFDPKNCVAIGAAIWGANRESGSWLEINNRTHERLTLELMTEIGPNFYKPVDGLQNGQAFPAEGTVPVEKGRRNLKLYRRGNSEPYVEFKFPPAKEKGMITVLIKGPSDYFVIVDGEERKGTVKS